MIDFEVLGDPKALKRHRMGRGFNYDPSAGDKATFAQIAQVKAPTVPLNVALFVQITFYFARPKHHYGTGKNSNKLKPNVGNYHTSKPDIDNLEKFVFDALTGIFWKDDSYISHVMSAKVYTEGTPKTVVYIKEAELPPRHDKT
ncbi:RusA family crossover junction endodeoxyribonuclease [Sphingobacterium griseoflavum]|uniref:Uncharacterized protein n=1 Tax=Sphingobacterium griseoflavum TaxID=1474952 RepID=A0ABQ3HZA7_9SPHI|nr:RusA family crossover junction endodeoxyribonuclease [Sphingobacterium griseoflavum]GHE35093.1 hypothetical protein GCM10017764_17900 [Sphingobacterium griseoflavum]